MDIALKQRLVGASVLVALAVVVLPMLLGGRPEDGGGDSRAIEIPEQPPELDFETRRYPIGATRPNEPQPDTQQPITLPTPDLPESGTEATDQRAAEADSMADSGAGPAPGEAIAGEDVPPAGTEEIASAEEEPPVTVIESDALPETAPVGSGRYIVQVASFGSVNNARRLTGQLQELGYAVTSDTVTSDVGTLHRVRVGPYANESDADRAVAALKSQVRDVTPRVMDMQPGEAAPVTQPADPLVRWVVQVGSFSSATNADNLVARLKLEGMNAYKESVSSGGSSVYRVRVGPFVERDEAIRIDRLIDERLSLDGVVMSAD